MILIQSLGSIAFLVGNEAFLRRSVGIETSLPFTIAIGLLAICFLAPLYLLFWATTLKD
ncbi:hypothetical protein HF072_05605 [Bacillus sp. RO3]|nr:hypothetical protein [Bacillus sp. RO3]